MAKTRRPQAQPVYQVIDVPDLTGGVDVRQAPTQLALNQARRLVNWSLSEPGSLLVRPGYLRFSTTDISTNRCQGGERVYLSSHVFTLVASSGHVFKLTDTGGWDVNGSTVAVYSTIQSTAAVLFPHDRDYVALFDGSTNAIRKSTDGSSWTRFGIAAPSTTSTLTASTASAGSLLANEYEVGFTYRNDSAAHDPVQESNGGPVSTITLGTTGALIVEVHGSTDPQVGRVYVYARNKTAGETLRRFSTWTSNVVAGSTLRVTLTDSNWSGALPEPTDHHVPPPLSIGVAWKNRWWARHATIGNRLHFTQIFQAQSWPATFFLDIPFDRGDRIRAVRPSGDTLMIFGATGIYLVIGQTSLDFEVRPAMSAQDGALGPRAVTLVEDGVIHAGARGIYHFDGAVDRLMSLSFEPGWRDVIRNASVSDLEQIAIVYHQIRKEVRVAVPRIYPSTGAGEWIQDLNRSRETEQPVWSQTDRPIGGYILWDGAEAAAGHRGRLFSWAYATGGVFEESTGTTANSSNMLAEYDGPTVSVGLNQADFIDLQGEYEPHGGDLTVEALVDEVSQGTQGVAIGAAAASYGAGVYGTATYGQFGRRKWHQFLPLGADGRSIQVKLAYSGQEAFRHYPYAIGLTPETLPRTFSE